MTAHEMDNMASRFLEARTSEIDDKVIPINTKKATTFSLSVFQGKTFIFERYSTCKFHKRSRNL